jgi:pimeloyl-ACP methyl ester carboxylesterase
MRRVLLALVLLLAAGAVLPPLWFRVFPVEPPQLDAAETFVALASGPRMHAIVRGDGPPIVLVHGLPGQASEWRETTQRLAALGRRAIALDRIGYGHSDARDGDDFTFDANARELREFLDALDLTDVTVVGWSYGGGVALTAARLQQEAGAEGRARIARLVLVGSIGPASEAPQQPPAIVGALLVGAIRWVRAVPPVALAVQRAASAQAFSDQAMPEWWLPGLAANLAQPKTQLALTSEGSGMGSQRIPDSTGLELPILVIHGDDDRLASIEMGRALVHNNPRAELAEVAGGSHMLPITHAALLADRIAVFSASAPAAEAPVTPSGADAGAPEPPEHWMDAVAAR